MNDEPKFQIGEWITPTWIPDTTYYLTLGKPYKVVRRQRGLPRIRDDEGDLITTPNTFGCAHLRHKNKQGYWVRCNPPEPD